MTSKLSRKTQDRRLHSLTNFITRDIMRLVKGMTTLSPSQPVCRDDFIIDLDEGQQELFEISPGIFPLRIDKSTLHDEYIEYVDANLSITVEINKASDRFNVSASDKPLLGISDIGMHILINIPPTFCDTDMKILRDEISNSVRHELEHISQGPRCDNPFSVFGRGKEYYTFESCPDDVETVMAKYLLDPTEIPAYVRGHSHNSSSMTELISKIDYFLNTYSERGFIDNDEKDIIFNSWIKWAQKFLNQKRFLS